jgi:hypothetical protein
MMMVTTSTQTHRHMPKSFDIHSDQHDKELKEWCQLHWQHIICKGIQGNNIATYHDCCISFSKKGSIKKGSHPAVQSTSILKILSLKTTSGPDDLYRWLKSRLRAHNKLDLKTYFPSINTAHFTTEDDYLEDPQEQVEMLAKRCNKVMEELAKSRDDLDRLRQENRVLLQSTKSWCSKYQELLLKQQDDTPSYAEITPLKPHKHQHSIDLLQI